MARQGKKSEAISWYGKGKRKKEKGKEEKRKEEMNRGRKEKKERRKGEGERTQQKKDIPLIEGWTDEQD